jgi:hypothetical protein
MCGIAGIIGRSKNPAVSYDIATKLFVKTESRGEDASGIWAAEPGNGKILYHKEPIKTTEFVQLEIWKRLKKLRPDLLLMHARAASFGVGSPKVNKNNHPFISSDKTTALIHNGRIPDWEYTRLKKQYEVGSDCDSEMFLRVFEHGKEPIDGIRDVWSYMYRSQMAVAIGERVETSRRLWLFRNDYRPIWITDMREALGQIFFFSDPDIWDSATYDIELGKVKLIELPTEMIWCFTTDVHNHIDLKKFRVTLKEFMPWNENGEKLEIKKLNSDVKIISRLDENEEVINKKKHFPPRRDTSATGWMGDKLFTDTSDNKKNLERIAEQSTEAKELLDNLQIFTENLTFEDSLEAGDYKDIMDSLDNVCLELKGSIRLLEAKQH